MLAAMSSTACHPDSGASGGDDGGDLCGETSAGASGGREQPGALIRKGVSLSR